jgi:prepilin-type N-terminal cleavage/methylation domain-containing protein
MTTTSTGQVQKAQRQRPQGFSLIELLVVMIVISILAGIALPRVNLHQFRIDAGIRVVQSALQLSARFAVQKQHDVYVSFDVPGKRLLVVDDVNNSGTPDGGEKVQWRVLEDGVRFAAPPSAIGGNAIAPVAGTNLKTINGLPTIIFRRDGAASTDLQVYITSTRPDPGDFKALSVTRSTGHVAYYRYKAGNWVRGGV